MINAMRKWLIRTSENEIIGPLQKEKVIELYREESISRDDEICMGNGYWFYIREEELLKRYLLEDEEQPFHPLSMSKGTDEIEDAGVKLPESNDLDYPEESSSEDGDFADITLISDAILDKGENEKMSPSSPTPFSEERKEDVEGLDSSSTPPGGQTKTVALPTLKRAPSIEKKDKRQQDDRLSDNLIFAGPGLLGFDSQKTYFLSDNSSFFGFLQLCILIRFSGFSPRKSPL